MDVTVAADEISSGRITLEPEVVTTVHFARDTPLVELYSDGAAEVWFTYNGNEPTINGQDCYYLPARAMSVDERDPLSPGKPFTLKLISDGAPTIVAQRSETR